MADSVITLARYFFLLLLVLPSTALAHQLDEYIHATLVSIEPGEIRIQVNLTPGVQVASNVLALIDLDHDGVISTNEAAGYAKTFQHDLVVQLDKHRAQLKLVASRFPAMSELRTGWGIIQLEFSISAAPVSAGAHKLVFEDRHLPAISAYLFNAAKPKSNLIQIVGQKRNQTQSLGEVAFNFTPAKP